MKKTFVLLCVLLFTVAVSSTAAGMTADPGGELRVAYGTAAENSGFTFGGLTLELEIPLSPDDGVKSSLQFEGTEPFTAYYYRRHIFKAHDELHLGRLTTGWPSGNSQTLNNSLAGQVISGYSTGTGLKHHIFLGNLPLVASITTHEKRNTRDNSFSGRLSFQPHPKWTIGTALAVINPFSGARARAESRHALLVDVVYNDESFTFLGEAVSSNLEGVDAQSGLYLEGAYALSRAGTAYAGLFVAEKLTNDRMVAGIRHQPADHLVLQAEAVSSLDHWRLTLQFTACF